MKARIAAVLSLTGVLAAGSAAALVNTRVLEGGAEPSASPANTIVASVPATGSTIAGGTSPSSMPDPSLPGSTTATSTPVPATPGAPSGTQAAYQVGVSGVVVLDTAGDRLTIVSVTPATGWQVIEAENNGSLNVEVKFGSGSTRVEFKANLLFGVVSTSVESASGSTTSGTGSGTTPSSGSVEDRDHDNSGHGSDDDEYDDDSSGRGRGRGRGGDDD